MIVNSIGKINISLSIECYELGFLAISTWGQVSPIGGLGRPKFETQNTLVTRLHSVITDVNLSPSTFFFYLPKIKL